MGRLMVLDTLYEVKKWVRMRSFFSNNVKQCLIYPIKILYIYIPGIAINNNLALDIDLANFFIFFTKSPMLSFQYINPNKKNVKKRFIFF